MQAAVEDGASAPERELLWIRRIASGDQDALERLYAAYQAPLRRYLLRMVGAAETAEELVNDVMVAVWKGAGRFRAESRASTWIFGIAHHKALNARRGTRPREAPVEEARELPSQEEGPEGRAVREGERQQLRRAVAALSPEHREVVHLTFERGLSYAEIADIVKCPVNTVKTRMFHARRRLQELVEGGAARRETA